MQNVGQNAGQIAAIVAALLLWALLPLLIHPTQKKNRTLVVAYLMSMSAAAALAAAAGTFVAPALGGFLELIYFAFIAGWTGAAVKARATHKVAKANAVANGWVAP
jgi:hypothetical protein